MSARRRGPGRGAGGVAGTSDALPALSSLIDLPSFRELRASERQRKAYARMVADFGDGEAELSLGCVVRLDRGFPAVACADAIFRAEYAVRLAQDGAVRAAVGDWVCVRRPLTHDRGVIEAVLPRESDVARWRGGARGERQTLAANVDVVLVAQALSGRPVSLDRIARSVVVARDCGADAAVVLTKADRCGGPGRLLADVSRVREVLGDGTRVVVTAAAAGEDVAREARSALGDVGVAWGDAAVRDLVPVGTVAIVLGESGAGKSTLLNALLGDDVLCTGAVRASDGAGRHTTVARRMVSLPGAGVVVDEPGLRSLPLVGHERGLALAFPEIASAARHCRFRDCTHTAEPGCQVRAALGERAFPKGRLDVYLSLAAEMRASAGALDPDVVL